MSNIKHAFIIPLIGGQALGQTAAFGSRPDYILSYGAFKNSDAHLLNYWNNEVPYYVIDEGQRHPHSVDVVGTTCPCAGLSSLSGHASPNSAMNDWMYKTAGYVLEQVRPKVFWGENAPGFAGKVGRPVVDKLRKIAADNGYTMSIYRTKSLIHGVPQVRERSFYFFWKGDRVPLLNYVKTDYPRIEDLILGVNPKATQHEVTNPAKPSEDPFYRYCLEVVHGGITHKQFFKLIDKTANAMSHFEDAGHTYDKVAIWARKQKLDKLAEKCIRIDKKLRAGFSVMRHTTTIPKDYIGAFVGHLPTKLTHPSKDRYLTVRECLSIMGMPEDFELIDPKRRLNHVCQNVPVPTATYAASQVKLYLEGALDTVRGNLICQFNSKKNHEDLDPGPIVTATLDTFM